MPNRNQCEVMGHLGKDPETRTLQNGQTVTSFSIATSNDYKDKSSGEWQKKDATWWNCKAWGDLGTVIT
ncbi:MAG: single-stranded DNA-binding protein, partial [Bacteroidales bacterium]|nr:single-stranded DNA-binding protein [Bacteroidales bacterium]